MPDKVKTETELQAWDQYVAGAISTAYKTVHGTNEHDFILKAAKKAADIADALLIERRKRC